MGFLKGTPRLKLGVISDFITQSLTLGGFYPPNPVGEDRTVSTGRAVSDVRAGSTSSKRWKALA
ncbi:MAG: hypothetical protein O9287_21390 [Microcystis sp. LE17-20D]|uniref:hypothetical protein n=1 Tax=Microcystis sp. M169S2 TaxID=2771157 RepID=UPI000CEA3CED|nr:MULTISPECIES: hypothetical protein [Microcystis]MCZ8068405.1 hypothetical protein [Microcystis sp. LE17-20D]MCZ8161433.1 hypothetical protein [Microcystis sp. LE19-196.1B]MCZ8275852.1 hypothetical protein [Microcystis sp. LE19-4.1E]WNF16234.1 hypothetical protein RKE53_07575 [Microcystis aeruginosa NRERC-214]